MWIAQEQDTLCKLYKQCTKSFWLNSRTCLPLSMSPWQEVWRVDLLFSMQTTGGHNKDRGQMRHPNRHFPTGRTQAFPTSRQPMLKFARCCASVKRRCIQDANGLNLLKPEAQLSCSGTSATWASLGTDAACSSSGCDDEPGLSCIVAVTPAGLETCS